MGYLMILIFAAATGVAQVQPPVADTLWTETRRPETKTSAGRLEQQTPGSERYARLEFLLEKTMFKIDVIWLTIVVDQQTADSVESLVSGNRRTDELEDAVASQYMETRHADISLEFLYSVGYGRFIGGVRETSELLVELVHIDEASAERVNGGMGNRFSFLDERGIREGDRLSYSVRGDSVLTSYVGVDGNTLLDDVVVGPEWRTWTLGSYFVPKTNFYDGLLDLIFGG